MVCCTPTVDVTINGDAHSFYLCYCVRYEVYQQMIVIGMLIQQRISSYRHLHFVLREKPSATTKTDDQYFTFYIHAIPWVLSKCYSLTVFLISNILWWIFFRFSFPRNSIMSTQMRRHIIFQTTIIFRTQNAIFFWAIVLIRPTEKANVWHLAMWNWISRRLCLINVILNDYTIK